MLYTLDKLIHTYDQVLSMKAHVLKTLHSDGFSLSNLESFIRSELIFRIVSDGCLFVI